MSGVAFALWLFWIAASAIERSDVGNLLMLAGILVAFPAWHAVAKALDRERQSSEVRRAL